MAQVFEGKVLVRPGLISSRDAAVPGKPLQVGILLKMAPKWHTYWINPGDAGMATTVKWTLPEGFGAGSLDFPIPQRATEPGDIRVYSYSDEVLLLTTISVPQKISSKEVILKADVDWLVCEKICIPGATELELKLPVADSAQPLNVNLFERFNKELPQIDKPPFSIDWKRIENRWEIVVTDLNEGESVDFYPLPVKNEIIGHAEKIVSEKAGESILTIESKGALNGVVVLEHEGDSIQREGWLVASPPVSPVEPTGPVKGISLGLALFYGLLGGLLLNVMPCVLPVISLKIFGFMQQAGDAPEKILRHGLAFTAGIFAWFLALAALIVTMKSAGHQVTWAFQFQNPWFIFFICSLVFVFALNLFGVFEIVLPGGAVNKMAGAGGREGYIGSFFQGGFATLLATPCTAPFLGAALGFAFSQPAYVIFAMFASVALGMALPYLLLSAQPKWIKLLPKPGKWMEYVKQFMGFPLLATVVWLLYVAGNQKGIDGMIWLVSFLLLAAFVFWFYGQIICSMRGAALRSVVCVLALILLISGGFALGKKFAKSELNPGNKSLASGDGIAWVPFSVNERDAVIASGKPLFIDFTADWCITCKFNERTAINTEAVRKLIKERDIVAMKADWTNSNPEITAALAEFGRVGVPFYLFYPGDGIEKPVIFPELLTEAIVLEKLATTP
ncbi:MAG: protein-disulfide reductase DsbD family protein [Chthoniobacterales bacterium]